MQDHDYRKIRNTDMKIVGDVCCQLVSFGLVSEVGVGVVGVGRAGTSIGEILLLII